MPTSQHLSQVWCATRSTRPKNDKDPYTDGKQQLCWRVAISTALAVNHMHDHALAIYVADLQPGDLAAAHVSAIGDHQQDALEQGTGSRWPQSCVPLPTGAECWAASCECRERGETGGTRGGSACARRYLSAVLIFRLISFGLPVMYCKNAGRAGLAVDHFGRYNRLHVHFLPVLGCVLE